MIAAHPYKLDDDTGYDDEKFFKEYCCELSTQFCYKYFERRPNDNGNNYAFPTAGMLLNNYNKNNDYNYNFCLALIQSDPHYRLFGRKWDTFHFQGKGRYLVMGIKDIQQQNVFLIHAQHTLWPDKTHGEFTCMRTIAFGLPNTPVAYQVYVACPCISI